MRSRAAAPIARSCAVLVAAAWALNASSSRAADGPLPLARRSVAGVQASFWATEQYGLVVPLVPYARYGIAGDLFADLHVPFALEGAADNDEPARSGLGNPTLAARWVATSPNGTFTWFGGIGIAFPLASTGDIDSDVATERAAAAEGYGRLYLWAVEYTPLVGTAGFEIRPAKSLWLRWTTSPALFVPNNDRHDLEPGMFNRFELEGRGRVAGGGFALQLVSTDVIRNQDDDPSQTSLETFFSLDVRSRFYLRAGMLLGLDYPLGPGFNERGLLATQLDLGIGLP